jgi:hypothetical protein
MGEEVIPGMEDDLLVNALKRYVKKNFIFFTSVYSSLHQLTANAAFSKIRSERGGRIVTWYFTVP